MQSRGYWKQLYQAGKLQTHEQERGRRERMSLGESVDQKQGRFTIF